MTRPAAYESWPRRRAPISVNRSPSSGNWMLSVRTPHRAWHYVKPQGKWWRRSWACQRNCPECRVWPRGSF